MSDRALKDFGPIADDYSFFERHATEAEAEAEARAYAARSNDVSAGGGTIRMLDFGCGSGTTREQGLGTGGWGGGAALDEFGGLVILGQIYPRSLTGG